MSHNPGYEMSSVPSSDVCSVCEGADSVASLSGAALRTVRLLHPDMASSALVCTGCRALCEAERKRRVKFGAACLGCRKSKADKRVNANNQSAVRVCFSNVITSELSIIGRRLCSSCFHLVRQRTMAGCSSPGERKPVVKGQKATPKKLKARKFSLVFQKGEAKVTPLVPKVSCLAHLSVFLPRNNYVNSEPFHILHQEPRLRAVICLSGSKHCPHSSSKSILFLAIHEPTRLYKLSFD